MAVVKIVLFRGVNSDWRTGLVARIGFLLCDRRTREDQNEKPNKSEQSTHMAILRP